MNRAFIAAVVDTLLPGDAGGLEGEPPLPRGSAAGIDLAALAKSHGPAFEAIARQAAGAEAFAAAAEPARIAAVHAVERAMPDAFRAMLSALLADYYESEPVLHAMDWRGDPPQPQGYVMPAQDAATTEWFGRVRQRRKLWRE
jgi:hypothetical protein